MHGMNIGFQADAFGHRVGQGFATLNGIGQTAEQIADLHLTAFKKA